ncbi:YolD-like family protein [Butyrivibrio sp. CB08]|uniref:YolD-like family protein n=1 Tax=Butyrivibrio sp. CB08 TaxID=2364879 RepID=UPI000EAAAD8D|nr:YolD-like family protein [Butyrivibrio sp. CB08]RKM61080.1 YolD-like family protein [Butyrivibrio sp. CB08]
MARQKMPLDKRAAQFLPFKAVAGLDEAIAAKEKITVPKIELSEDSLRELDKKMHLIRKGMMVSVVYFHKEEYLKITGMVARLDETARILQVVNTKIEFDDILDVEF